MSNLNLDHIEASLNSLLGDIGVEDERPLDDLHLNNAINLDFIRTYFKQDVGYNIKIPRYIQMDLQTTNSIFGILSCRNLEIGFQRITTEIAACGPRTFSIGFDVAHKIVKTIKTSCSMYKLHIPISEVDPSQVIDLKMPKNWWTSFERILGLINGRSELRRDATKIRFVPHVEYHGSYVSTYVDTYHGRYNIYSFMHTALIIKEGQRKYKKEMFLGSFDSLLLLLDTLGQRICLYIANQICIRNHVKGSIPFPILEAIISTGDECIRELGNKAYDFLSMFEATCVSVLLQKNPDPINDPNMFFNNCIKEISELYPDLNDSVTATLKVNQWITQLNQLGNEEISNIFCLYRIWGHPIVDIHKGMEKVFTLATTEKFIPRRMSEIAVLQFKKMFLVSFYKQHKVYPKMNIQQSYVETYIGQCLSKNTLINESDTAYSFNDFEGIEIQKIWDIPETYDIFHILNDKAVSPTKSELYDNIKSGKGTQCGELRRGLWRWLQGDSIRCRELLNKIDEQGLDDDSHIIGLYEKEREIKITARMFALMSEEMRYYFVLTEEMIANYVLKYFPEITMKDSLNILLRKLWTHSKRETENKLDVNINIDFSKWNLNMRDELVHDVFVVIDKLFGYNNLIARTHEIFSNSYIYSASGKYEPKINNIGLVSDPPMAYTGHKGGFEGLRQKGWTIVTVLILSYIADFQKTRISLMGQGDNQVVKIHMPRRKWSEYRLNEEDRERDARDICSRYIKDMELNFRSAQLPIKVRETWRSCNLFMYGKMMTMLNKTLPQWYKKVLRSYALSNEGVLTFGGVVGTISTNMCSAASTSEKPDIMYVIYLILAEWSIWTLLGYHPFTRISYMKEPPTYVALAEGQRKRKYEVKAPIWNKLVATLLTIPTSVGGNITIPMTSFICRGFPDPATEGYTWVKFLMNGEGEYTDLFRNWYSFKVNPTAELDQLVQSPLSLNHHKPPTPGMQSRDVVREWLLDGKFKKNRFITNVSEIMKPFDRKKVCEELVTNPFSPLIASELYQILPQVALDSVLRRVENTRTIRRMALTSRSDQPIISKLMSVETNFLAYLIWRMNIEGTHFSSCATAQVRKSRDLGWGRTIVHITTPHPFELLLGKRCGTISPECQEQDHIYARISKDGKFAPYLGSKTKVKVHTTQDEAARREPLLSMSARLARYTSWLGLGTNTKRFIEKTVRITCNLDIFDNFFAEDMAQETFTGSVEHRFQPSGVSDGSFINYAPQLGQSVFLSSDYLPTYGRGQTNYTLAFQPMLVVFQFVAAYYEASTCLHFHLDCKECIVETVEEIPDIRESKPWIDKALHESHHDVIRETLGQIIKKPILTELQHPELVGITKTISDVPTYFIEYSIYRILGHKLAITLRTYTENKSDDIGTEDLQSYPRIYAYKIYTDTILEYTASALIFQSLLKNDQIPSIQNIMATKRRLVNHINNLPIQAFKDLGSLTVGRIFSEDGTSHMLISNQFPESVEGYLEGIRSSLTNTIENLIELEKCHDDTLYLPISYLTKRIHLYILIEKCVSKGCMKHLSSADLEESITKDIYPECKERCMREAIKTTYLTNASVDKFFKFLPLLKSAPMDIKGVVDMNIITSTVSTNANSTGVVPEHLLTKYRSCPERERHICFPTASIYKWEPIAKILSANNFIIFGDGTGGTSMVFASYNQESTIHPCALLEQYRCIPQDVLSIVPPLSRRLKNVSHNLHLKISDNIKDPKWSQEISKEIDQIGTSNLIVISDVESQGGNRELQDIIISSVPENTHLCLKLYLHEYKSGGFLRSLSGVTLLSCSWANLRYGEIFVYGVKKIGNTGVKEDSLVNGIKRICESLMSNALTDPSPDKQLVCKYPTLWKYNVSHSLQILCKCGIPISKDILNLKMFEVIGYITAYITNHYHFGKQREKEGTRPITAFRQSQLDNVIVTLLCIYIENYKSCPGLFMTKIMPMKNSCVPVIKSVGSNTHLKKEYLSVINVLKMYRRMSKLEELYVDNFKKTLKSQKKYVKNHRTYTWSLATQNTYSINCSTLPYDYIEDI